MERGRIKAHGDSKVSAVTQDQFQWGWGLGDLMIHDGRQRSGTDMDRQEGGQISFARRRGWGRLGSARATRRESGSELIRR